MHYIVGSKVKVALAKNVWRANTYKVGFFGKDKQIERVETEVLAF